MKVRGRGSLFFFALLGLMVALNWWSRAALGDGVLANFYALAGINGVNVSNYSRVDGYLDPPATGVVDTNAVGLYRTIATNQFGSAVVLGGSSHVIGYVYSNFPSASPSVSGGATYFGGRLLAEQLPNFVPNPPATTSLGNLSVAAGKVIASPSPNSYQTVTVSGGGELDLLVGQTYFFQSLTVIGGSVQTVPSPSPPSPSPAPSSSASPSPLPSSSSTPTPTSTGPTFVFVTGTGDNLLNLNHANVNTKVANHFSESLVIECLSSVTSATIATTSMTAVVYAPATTVNISSLSEIWGAVTGLFITCSSSKVHYDTALTAAPLP